MTSRPNTSKTFSRSEPAIHRNFASSQISCMRSLTLGEVPIPSKTQAFLCLQIHHATITTKELNPLRWCFSICCIAKQHHSIKLRKSGSGVCCCIRTKDKTEYQTSLEKTHNVNKCCTFSSSWPQSDQYSSDFMVYSSMPCFCSVVVPSIRQRPLGFVYSLIIDYIRDYTYIGERGDGPRGLHR